MWTDYNLLAVISLGSKWDKTHLLDTFLNYKSRVQFMEVDPFLSIQLFQKPAKLAQQSSASLFGHVLRIMIFGQGR